MAHLAQIEVAGAKLSCDLDHQVLMTEKPRLDQLAAAASLDDLRAPPANRLEPLNGSRKGQFSIRINDQFRLCFRWASDGAHDVEVVDYH